MEADYPIVSEFLKNREKDKIIGLGEAAYPALIEALHDEKLRWRVPEVVKAIIEKNPESAEYFFLKIIQLGKAYEGSRVSIEDTIGIIAEINPENIEPGKAIPLLEEYAKTGDDYGRSRALRLFSKIVRADPTTAETVFPTLLKALKDEAQVHSGALDAIVDISEGYPDHPEIKKAIPVLIDTVGHLNIYRLREIIDVLMRTGESIVPLLEKKFSDENDHVRFNVATVIGHAADVGSPEFCRAIDELTAPFKDDERECWFNNEALVDISKKNHGSSAMIIPILEGALKDGNANDNKLRRAIRAIGRISKTDPENAAKAIPVLIEKLGFRRLVVRQAACISIGEIAKHNPKNAEVVKALPLLKARLADRSKHVRKSAVVAMGKFNPDLLDLEDQISCLLLSNVKGKIGKINEDAVPLLLKHLEDEDPIIVGRAAFLLGKTKDPSVIPILVGIIRSQSKPDSVRSAAAEALCEMGLEKLGLEDRVMAMLLAGKTDQSHKTNPMLIEMLKDQSSTIRTKVVSILVKKIENGYGVDLAKVGKSLKAFVAKAKEKGSAIQAKEAKNEATRNYQSIANALKEVKASEKMEGVLLEGSFTPKRRKGVMFRAAKRKPVG